MRTIFKLGIWRFEKSDEPGSRPWLVCEGVNKTHTESPCHYGKGEVGYDWPELIPARVKARVSRYFLAAGGRTIRQGIVVILTTDQPHYGVVESTVDGWTYVWFPHLSQVIECRTSELILSEALGYPNFDKDGRITEAGKQDAEENHRVFMAWMNKRLIPDKVELVD